MSKVGTTHAAMSCDQVQCLTHFGETDSLSEQGLAPAEKYLVRVWSESRSTTTAETFNQLRVEQHTSSSVGTDYIPPTSSEIGGHVHGGAFRLNKARRLHVTDHAHSVAMVSYTLLATMCRSARPIHVPLVLVLHRATEDCL